ncbi:MAG: hypothetical protein Q9217_004287 [Psora testacea]
MDPSSTSTAVRSALTLGFTCSGVLAGTNIAISLGIIPSMLQLPKSLLIQQWRSLYKKGAMMAPPFAAFAFANLTYVAYTLYHSGNKGGSWKGIAIAAIATLAIVPFTIIFAHSTIEKLMAASEKPAALSEEEMKDLVQQWSNFNTMRSLFPLFATAIGLWAALA